MPRVAIPENSVGLARTTDAKLVPARNGGGVTGAIAAGMQSLGQEMGQAAETFRYIDDQRAETDAKEADIRFSRDAEDIRNKPGTGILTLTGKSAVDAYQPAVEALTKASRDAEQGLSSTLARRLFRQSADQRIAAYRDGITRHVAVQDGAWRDATSDSVIETNVAAAVSAADDVKLADASIATALNEVAEKYTRNGFASLVPAQQAKVESGARLGIVQRLADGSPEAAAAYYDRYKGKLQGQDLTVAERAIRVSADRAEAEQRRAVAEQRANDAHQLSLTREQLATAKVQLDSGAGSSADWLELAGRYTAIGDTSAAAEAQQRAAQTRAVESHRGAPLADLDSRIGELKAKRSMTVGEASELKGLDTLRAQTASRLEQSGGALWQMQYATGATIAPLSPADPATYRARAVQAITASQTYGRRVVEPLTQTEAQPLKDMVAGDSTKRLQALQTIAKFGDPRAIDGAARQISSKEDGSFRIAATLSVLPGDVGFQAARDILRGPEAAKTNGGVYLPAQARRGFATYAAPALRGLSPDYASDVMDAARNLYTARMTTAGRTDWDDQAWRIAIDTALGGYRKDGVLYGGIATYKDTAVSVPPGWTGEGVFRRLARATGADLSAAAASKAPEWPDGSPVYSAQLRDLVPVRLGGTRYGFMTRNSRMLGARGGGPYVLDVAKVPWK